VSGPSTPKPRHWPLSLERTQRTVRPASERVVTTADAQTLRPQRPLSDALREAALLRGAPTGYGGDLTAFRLHMVARLRQAGCRDEGVLAAMACVPRHQFVDSALATQAYEDTSLPIGLGQTISKPSVVARMVELLRQRPGGPGLERVLEIGTGGGYQAAVLAQLAMRTISVERLRGLHERAVRQLAPLQLTGLTLVLGDGRLGHSLAAPYDGIIAAAGGHDLPHAWVDQLARGGRLVAPVQDPALGCQVLMVVDKLGDGSIVQRVHEAVRFVPLESGLGDS
jgi:protein-L-isoaspartate(D-aspartate) O-methyltransferase